MWGERTKLEKRLIVVSAILIVAVIIVSIFLGIEAHKAKENSDSSKTTGSMTKAAKTTSAVPTNYSTAATPKSYTVCDSDICIKSANDMLFAMNASVDPCDDFYQFACGNWIQQEKLKPSQEEISVINGVQSFVNNKIIDVLENEDTKKYSEAMKSAITLYKQCLNTDELNKEGIRPLQELVSELLGSDWPIANGTWNDKHEFLPLNATANLIRGGIPAFLNVDVGIDMRNASRYTIELSKLRTDQFGLDVDILANITASKTAAKYVEAYVNLITDAAIIMSGNDTITDLVQLQQDVEGILAIEMYLAKLSNLSDPGGNIEEHSVSLNDNEILLYFLKNVIPNGGVTEDTEVYFFPLVYVEYVFNGTLNTTRRDIANYLGWNVVRTYGLSTVDSYRKAYLDFQKVVSGVSAFPPRNVTCATLVNEVYGYAVAGEYAEQYFPESAKGEVKEMMDNIIEAFEEKLEEIEWMDNVTRSRALTKAKLVVEFIAYPEWTLRNAEVDKFYSELIDEISEDNEFLVNIQAYQNFVTMVNNNKLHKKTNRQRWDSISRDLTPLTTNAFYDPSTNSIHILAGILDGKFYQHGRPASINYGSIGVVMGHELTHGFDNTGRYYDGLGNVKNWWMNETLETYIEKTECFVKQYSEQYDKQAKMNVSGNLTLGENIADNGGIRRAFTAYEAYIEKHGKDYRLPGLETFTPHQLFFLAYGNIQCSKERTPFLKRSIRHNPHSPPEFRVNVVLSNFEEFSNTFSCKLHTKMHPEHRCAVW